MKKILALLTTLMAMNFVAVIGFLAFLGATGHLGRGNIENVRLALYPPTSQPASQPASQPTTAEAGSGGPLAELEQDLAKLANRPANEQMEFLRHSVDEQMGQLDRRAREVDDLRRQVEAARAQLALDRQAVELREKALASREATAADQEKDDGFQKELALYATLPPAQVKKLISAMDDDLAARYITALPSRVSSKVLKEFQTADDTTRLQAIMEKIRKPGPGGAQVTAVPNQPAAVGAERAPNLTR